MPGVTGGDYSERVATVAVLDTLNLRSHFIQRLIPAGLLKGLVAAVTHQWHPATARCFE
jgi:hypothetical protein